MYSRSSISTRASGVARASNSCGRLLFSTSQALRGGGPLFNLGGLGASREAQYLSRERGIPRTEYSANIHLIRSSEVDPFAPAPGSTRSAAARAAARAQTEAQLEKAKAQLARGARNASTSSSVAYDPKAVGGLAGLAAQLQAMRVDLAATKMALLRLQAKGEKPETSTTSYLLSTAIILAVVFFVGKDISDRLARPTQATDGLIQARTLADEVDEAMAQRQRDAPAEEQVLAESGLTSFEHQPATSDSPRTSVLGGLFWARA
ncbi:hypothetical protein Daus18300_002275 [Diaporthe australafricana]|uniref:Uncharacterized protein n=1 Tax=Diaporthe australafricana TaxID=127596 RepID=A0ABR3XPK3_9PEZI